jgi:hypothetical protein
MRNEQLKPAYNIQYGIDAEYVVWVTAGPPPTDTTALITLVYYLMTDSVLLSTAL